MTSRVFSTWLGFASAAIGFALLASTPAFAQDEAETVPPAKVVVTTPDGTTSGEYLATDVSAYFSEIAAYDSVPAHNELTFSFSTISPVDTALLEWAAFDGEDNLRNVTITATFTDGAGDTREMKYELTGARVTSVSTGASSYTPTPFSLSVTAEKVIMDGVPMN